MSDSWISPKIEVRESPITGIGTFTREPIKKDEIVFVQGGIIITDSDFDNPLYEPYAYHCYQVEKDMYICPSELKKEKFDAVFNVNHSCNPNCGFHGQITFVAMRDIVAGEEITFDYAMSDVGTKDLGWEPMKCACGSKECRNSITGEDWKIKELQKKYKGYFSRYVQDLIDTNNE